MQGSYFDRRSVRAPGTGFQLPVRPAELRRPVMLEALPAGALADLAGRARRRRFRAGEVVFNEGDAGNSLHVVRRGQLKVVRPTYDDRLVLDTVEAGEGLRGVAGLDSSPRSASLVAPEGCGAREITQADLERVLGEHPQARPPLPAELPRPLT